MRPLSLLDDPPEYPPDPPDVAPPDDPLDEPDPSDAVERPEDTARVLVIPLPLCPPPPESALSLASRGRMRTYPTPLITRALPSVTLSEEPPPALADPPGDTYDPKLRAEYE